MNIILIEHGCTIDASARIGTEPYSLKNLKSKRTRIRVEPKAGVHIKNFVTIGAHVSIQKGIKRDTLIGPYTHINDGVRIGHDVKIGKGCLIGLNSTISGYSEIGDYTRIDPGCTVSNRIIIGKNARVRIGSLVIRDIPKDGDFAGRPAIPFIEFKRRRKLLKDLMSP